MSPDPDAVRSKKSSGEGCNSTKRSKRCRTRAPVVESEDENKWCSSESKSVHSFEWTVNNLAEIVCDGSMPRSQVDLITSRGQSKWTAFLRPGELSKSDSEETKVFVYALCCLTLRPGLKSALVNVRWHVRTLGRCRIITEERALQFHPEDTKEWTWSTTAAGQSLTFRCDIQIILSEKPSSQKSDFADTLEGSLLSGLLFNFLNGHSSGDVVFDAGGTEFKLHKDVLSAKSAVFAYFFGHHEDDDPTEVITFVNSPLSAETFAIIVRYLYTGEVPLMVHVPTLEDVWYGCAVDGLRELCQDRLFKMIDSENALDMLMFAELKEWFIFKSVAAKYIVDNLPDMVTSRKWEVLQRDFPHIVLDLLLYRRTEFRKTLKF